MAMKNILEAEAQQFLNHLSQAWNNGDADQYGSYFTPDATYVAFFGSVYRGKSEIVESHRLLFKGPLKGTKLSFQILNTQVLNSETIVVTTRGDVSKKLNAKPKKVQSYTLVKSEGAWKAAHFQNTKDNWFFKFLTNKLGPGAIPSLDL